MVKRSAEWFTLALKLPSPYPTEESLWEVLWRSLCADCSHGRIPARATISDDFRDWIIIDAHRWVPADEITTFEIILKELASHDKTNQMPMSVLRSIETDDLRSNQS
jgi:hypothetical protein